MKHDTTGYNEVFRVADLPLSRNVHIESHSARPGYSKVLHRHGVDSLLYMVSGCGRCVLENEEVALSPDTAILLKSGTAHRFVDKPGHSMLIFAVYFAHLEKELSESVVAPLMDMASPLLVPPHFTDEIKGTLRRMLFEQEHMPSHYRMALEQCLTSILLRLYRIGESRKVQGAEGSAGGDSVCRVDSVLEHIKANYYLRHNLATVAKSAGLSQRQFSNLCKEATGLSFVRFLNSIRTNRALELIESSDMQISAIAFEVGYEELSTFYRAFKRIHGKSPLAFRKDQLA